MPSDAGPQCVLTSGFRNDIAYWIEHDRKLALKIMKFVEATMRDPCEGIGKPEPLRYMGANVWSRRLTQEHRLVYLVEDQQITFLQGRYHY